MKFTDEQYHFNDEHQKSGGVTPPHPPVGSPLMKMLYYSYYSIIFLCILIYIVLSMVENIVSGALPSLLV